MSNLDHKIAVLLPYDELINFATEIAEKLKIKILIRKISTENAVDLAKEFCEDGGEIIISRGNLAKKIQDNVDIDVVCVNFSGYEFLEALYKYKDFKQPIGIVENETIIEGFRQINKFLNLDLHYYQTNAVDDFSNKTMQALDDGVKLLIGGSWGIEIRKFLALSNIQYEMVKSQKPSVENAINSAIAICNSKTRKQSSSQMLKTILEFSSMGIVVVNKNDRITNINLIAQNLLHSKTDFAIGQYSSIIAPNLNLKSTIEYGAQNLGRIEQIFGKELTIDTVPLMIRGHTEGAIAFIQDCSNVISRPLMPPSPSKDDVVSSGTSSIFPEEINNLSSIYANTNENILICGEIGTGKKLLSESIHQLSKRKNQPFLLFNCAVLDNQLGELFEVKKSSEKKYKLTVLENANMGTIGLENIENLDLIAQAKLFEVVRSTKMNIRFIATTSKDLWALCEEGAFRKDLFYVLSVLDIHLPPLRNRREDIPNIANQIHAEVSADLELSYQPLEPQILAFLKQQKWVGNISELRNAIKKIVILRQSGLSITQILSLENTPDNPAQFETEPKQTLENIERQAIAHTLALCAGNKTKAALSLGINRTTLLRKIAQYKLDIT